MAPLTILYVDDDADIREIAALSLALDGRIEARTAESGAVALAMIDAGFAPDAILLDVMMPGLDGPGALALIRQRPAMAETPVIFITARALQTERQRFLSLGALGVIVKPFDPISLAGQVRQILGHG